MASIGLFTGSAVAAPVVMVGGRPVADKGARDGRAIEVRRGQSVLLRARPDALRGIVMRARSVGCQVTRLVVRARGVVATVAVTPTYRRHAVRLERPRTALRVVAASTSPRCRARLDPADVQADRAVPRRGAASPRVKLGSAVALDHLLGDPLYARTLESTFRSLTPENELKMERTQPKPGQYDFAAGDAVVNYAAQRGFEVRGHTLVYGAQTPPWVGRLLFPDLVQAAMLDHIRTVIGRYRDRIHEWDVVNEALDSNGAYRHNPFFDALGPGYVATAFRAAREADPTAKLFYNEIDAESPGPKRDATLRLVRGLARDHLIDGVGLQMHVGIHRGPTRDQLEATMREYERLGLQVKVTEMDVAAGGLGNLDDRLRRQADTYRDAALACVAVLACSQLTVWGVSDRFSWLGPDQLPLLFDSGFQPKPALAAIQSALAGSLVAAP